MNNLLIYCKLDSYNKLTSVSLTDLNNAVLTASNGMAIFSRINMQSNFVAGPTNGYLIENRELTRDDNVNLLVADSFQQALQRTGVETLEFVVSTGADTSLTVMTKF